MKEEQDYVRDLADIRSMMERSSRFVFISSWAGFLAGGLALIAAGLAHWYLLFRPDRIDYKYTVSTGPFSGVVGLIFLGIATFMLSAFCAFITSARKAERNGVKVWTAVTRRLFTHLLTPLLAGGALILILAYQGLTGFILPFSLLFYGLGMFSASKFTYDDLRILGIVEIILGLIGCCFIEYGLLLWALGFGLVHIAYGIFVRYKHER